MLKLVLLLLLSLQLSAKDTSREILTNSVRMRAAPRWLTSTRINKVADRVQSTLEWTIRRAEVLWYSDEDLFIAAHGLSNTLVAFSQKTANTIHLGPKITEKNFDQIFAHELVHIVAYQKYKQAIPGWLEEGLANHVGKVGKVDYQWLKNQPALEHASELAHPLVGSEFQIHYRYVASQALAEMLHKKCDFKNLLRLSVGRKMEDYISTYCGIKDLDAAFRSWIKEKGV
ncbi:MAG: hypothetical protein A4S09_05530 [Proteobacteria bacterium SG_bin7]|nr:MAG: hypothetical protein A4S09_05530 [Proteobacteria bacterium SG_bin7]